jgi:hypothetical protein
MNRLAYTTGSLRRGVGCPSTVSTEALAKVEAPGWRAKPVPAMFTIRFRARRFPASSPPLLRSAVPAATGTNEGIIGAVTELLFSPSCFDQPEKRPETFRHWVSRQSKISMLSHNAAQKFGNRLTPFPNFRLSYCFNRFLLLPHERVLRRHVERAHAGGEVVVGERRVEPVRTGQHVVEAVLRFG